MRLLSDSTAQCPIHNGLCRETMPLVPENCSSRKSGRSPALPPRNKRDARAPTQPETDTGPHLPNGFSQLDSKVAGAETPKVNIQAILSHFCQIMVEANVLNADRTCDHTACFFRSCVHVIVTQNYATDAGQTEIVQSPSTAWPSMWLGELLVLLHAEAGSRTTSYTV